MSQGVKQPWTETISRQSLRGAGFRNLALVPCLTRWVQSRNMKSRRSFIAFPERFARRIHNQNIVRFALTRIAAVKRRCCGFCVRVLPVFNAG